MKEDLFLEYMKFKSVADIQIAKMTNDQDKESIRYRLSLLKRRFDDYDAAGFDLTKVRLLEQARFAMLTKLNQSMHEPRPSPIVVE